jgi:hypothetical protein
MAFIRRFALVVSIVICGSLAWAAAANAAGGGGGIGPGDYVFVNTNAEAQFGFPNDPTQTSGFSVFVSKGLNSFQLEHPKKSPPVVTTSTIVNLQTFDSNNVSIFYCFVLSNQSDFAVSADLKSASLHTLLTADEMCNFGGPVPGTGKGAFTPFAGSGGGPQPSIQVDITWTGTGVTGSGKDRSSFDCGSFRQDVTNVTKTAGSNAVGTVTGVRGSWTTSFAGINSTSVHMDVKGFPLQGCFG